MTLIVSIAGLGCVNWGNILIQAALEKCLPFPQVYREWSQWHLDEVPMTDANGNPYTDVVVTGAVLHEPSLHRFIGRLDLDKTRLWMIGVSFAGEPVKLDWGMLGHRNIVVGARDPHALVVLRSMGVVANLVGCPTMAYVSSLPPARGAARFISVRRGGVPLALSDLPADPKWCFVKHQDSDSLPTGIMDKCPTTISLAGMDPWAAIAMYANADVVVTSRLHAALPALMGGACVHYVGDPADGRNTLLAQLGVEVHSRDATELAPECYTGIEHRRLIKAFRDMTEEFRGMADYRPLGRHW